MNRLKNLLGKVGISKKESVVILTAIYANPFIFLPTIIAIIYIIGRIIFNFKKRKNKPQEL